MIPFLSPQDPMPPVERALDEPNGLLAAGGGLSVARLVDAYRHGVFPWFSAGDPVLWWCPDPRMVLPTAAVHVSRSLRRRLKRPDYTVSLDRAFGEVVAGCAAPRRDEPGTWLVPAMRQAYLKLFDAGFAHSLEVWMDGTLAGGIYGVALGRMFFGESMFSRRTDASKIAIVTLAEHLAEWGCPIIDCQMRTEHLASLGAVEIPRAEFVEQVAELAAQAAPAWQLGGTKNEERRAKNGTQD